MHTVNELVEIRYQQPGVYAYVVSQLTFERLLAELKEFPFCGAVAKRTWGVPVQVLLDCGGESPLWVLRSEARS